uniref:Uncharacterized protein n=1 Tax=Sphaerodactylus townsendi TaxID=933632 RepID=A0ACB8EVQ1_9SAUR
MERETGNIFLQLQEIIQKNGKDPDRFMTEAERQRQNFSQRLEKVSKTLVKERKIRFQPYELADCGSCHVLKAPCNDLLVCAGPNVLAGVLVTLAILLGAGGGVWYYRCKKAGEKGESKTQEDDDTESLQTWGSSEWSDESDEPSLQANAPNPTWNPYQNVPPVPGANAPNPSSTGNPYQNVPPAPQANAPNPTWNPYQNVPPAPEANAPNQSSTWSPYQNVPPIPSPPHIWSPPS